MEKWCVLLCVRIYHCFFFFGGGGGYFLLYSVSKIILDRLNEKLRPPFQLWKNGALCFVREFIIDFFFGGGGAG